MKCKICDKEFNGVLGLPGHLRHNHKGYTVQKYYDDFYKKDNEGICKYCNSPTKFRTFKIGYNTYCSNKCIQNSEEVKEKRKQTFIEKFGVDNPSKSPEIRNKTKETCEERYGGIGFKSEKLREKNKKTMIEKYGVEYYLQSDEGIKKLKETKLERYNDENYNNFEKGLLSKQSTIKQHKINGYTTQNELVKYFGQGWLTIKEELEYKIEDNLVLINNKDIPKILEYSKTDHRSFPNTERSVLKFIKSIYTGKIIVHTRQIIAPLELDIYLPEVKLAIEINGMYWHSNIYLSKNYHLDKSKLCQEKGIKLIHIYEWELEEPYWSKIKIMLNHALRINPTIYAHNCIIKKISNSEAKLLNNKVHLQGHRNAQVTYGLFYQNELVQLMSFSKTKNSRNLKDDNDWEIIRSCPSSNMSVIDGISKLFKHFIKEYKPDKIFSYCDFNKFDGKSYGKLGMKFIGYTGPNKIWIIDGKPIKRNLKKYQELKDNYFIMDSGSKKYLWEVK